jgi:hypothetical protein
MPQVQPVASQIAVRAEVQRASSRTGVDFDYLLGQASMESSLDPSARASTSSASGLFQFISSTWLNTVEKHGAEHGLGWAAAQIEQTGKGPVVRDPAMRQQILALRFDPQVASLMAGEFANDNRGTLQAALGREPNGTDLYLAHFLGPAGATSFLQNAQRDPDAAAASLFPKAASSNRSIFFDAGGDARSLGQVYGLLQNKMETAVARNGGDTTGIGGGIGGGGFDIAAMQTGGTSGGYARQPARSFDPPAPPAAPPSRLTMADTLRASFGLDTGGSDAGSTNVRQAYARLQAFGL